MKQMKQIRYKNKLLILILLLFIGLGYSLLSANLMINGTSKITASTWDIHFENIEVNSKSVPLSTGDSPATIQSSKTEVRYIISLNKPGDFYEFTVDVVNAGTIDGMVKTVTSKLNNEIITTLPSYLNYTISYSNGRAISPNQLLKTGERETYRVRIEYKKNIEINELPSTEQTLTMSFGVDYIQADTNAIPIIPEIMCTYDGELVQGAEYVNGQYTYHYLEEYNAANGWQRISNGWGVALTDVVNNAGASTEAVTSSICTYINKEPITSASSMFYNSQATSIDVSSFNTRKVTNMFTMFKGVVAPTLDLTNFDTSNVTNMEAMFYASTSTNLLIQEGFNTSKVTSMKGMFNHSSFHSIDVSHFDTSNVLDMGNMFDSTIVTTLDISGFDTSKVEDISGMFARTPNLTSIDISHFDTSKVTGMRSLFNESSVRSIIVNHLNTSNVTNMQTMFANTKITSLDLSSFDTKKVENMYGMFKDCTNLEIIYVSELWDTTNVTSGNKMFENATKLPNYSSSNTSKTKAHYNAGGYLTYKANS